MLTVSLSPGHVVGSNFDIVEDEVADHLSQICFVVAPNSF